MDPILPTTVVPPPGAPQPQPQPPAQPPPGATTAKIVYALYLASLVLGVTWLVGLVIAYVYVGDAPEPLKSHYRFQIRTFWIGLLYCVVGVLLTWVFVGAAVLAFFVVWVIVRCVKGLKALDRGAAYPNVTTWLW
jgi:uncharacterized membrane protein